MTPIRLGMVGGGIGGNIGKVHRIAARLDGAYTLVAGALSSQPQVAEDSAQQLGLARSYTDWREMAQAEAARPDGIEAVAIVTPNHLHRTMTQAFLDAGIHVVLDKPLTTSLGDAMALAKSVRAAQAKGVHFLLTHPYVAYPMVQEARALVAAGTIGKLRVAQVEYAQDWLARDLPGNKQAAWRLDPQKAGAGALGDIGTHAFHILGYVSGERVTEVSAQASSLVHGRVIDDDVQAMLRFEGGARGMLWASQVAAGRENSLKLRLFGADGSIEFDQESPNSLRLAKLGQPVITMTRAGPGTTSLGARLPAGHPEGYLGAFATLYAQFARVLRGKQPEIALPGLSDGLEGMAFVDAVLRSSAGNGAWTTLAATN